MAGRRYHGEGALAAAGRFRRVEQEHDLYCHQEMRGKGPIERREPNFLCHACITKEAAQQEEADTLLDKVFGGSAELLFASVLSGRKLKKEELERLRARVEAQEG